MMMVVMVMAFREYRAGEHHQKQCCCKNFLHGVNPTTIPSPIQGQDSTPSRQKSRFRSRSPQTAIRVH